jgi:hypothetical protein
MLSNKLQELQELQLTVYVTTLVLGSQPRQRLTKVRTKCEVRESHFMFLGVWENEGMNPHTPK